MTRLEHTDCASCAHFRELTRYAVPTCAKATHPHGKGAQVAAALAWERCQGKHFKAKR